MIGNDVVDLQLATRESNWQRRGFLQKLFTIQEQDLILQAENPEHAVWNLWSRKEAAYKIFNRETGIRKFMPLQFRCRDLNDKSIVRCNNAMYYTTTRISSQRIDTIALLAKSQIHNVIQVEKSNLIKINNLPFIKNSPDLIPASVSHHGRFYAAVAVASFNSETRFELQEQ